MKIDKKDRRADPNNVYVTVIGKSVNLRSVLLRLCLKAISLGRTTVTAYRARPSKNPRPESVAIENQEFDANKLLSDLRNNPGIDTAFGLPPCPNSGMSAKL